MKFIGLDPILNPIPVRPVAHYSMGIETDIKGATAIKVPGQRERSRVFPYMVLIG